MEELADQTCMRRRERETEREKGRKEGGEFRTGNSREEPTGTEK
jgi:hypothetical protein